MEADSKETISVYEVKNRRRSRKIYTQNDFVREQDLLVVKFDGYKLSITRAGMDFRGHTIKGVLKQTGTMLSIVADIPKGQYQISDESNEDELIVYIN